MLLMSQYLSKSESVSYTCPHPVSSGGTNITMGTSILTRFLALLFCIILPLYLALYAPTSLSDIRLLFTSITQRAKAVHVALTSPLAPSPVSIFKEAPETSTELAEPVRAPTGGKRTKEPPLPDGLAHCINSFEQYPVLAENVLQRKYARYAKQTPEQKALSKKLDYATHFEKARKGIDVNAQFSEQIARIAREIYHTGLQALEDEEDAEFGVVSLAFGHLARDWSSQGARERQAVFPSILDGLQQHFGGNGREKKVLVPGSGTGRLASDIADLGRSIFVEVRGMVLLWRRILRDGQRAGLQLHLGMASLDEPHKLAARTHTTPLFNKMDAPSQPLLAILCPDGARPLAQQSRQARRGRLFGNVPPGRRFRRHRHAVLHRHWRQRDRFLESYTSAAETRRSVDQPWTYVTVFSTSSTNLCAPLVKCVDR
jgi:hypothetical protein